MTVTASQPAEPDLEPAAVETRRMAPEPTAQTIFKVASLWGTSDLDGIEVPLNDHEAIRSGQVTLMLDPEAPAEANLGVIRYGDHALRVRYSVQVVFPGLYDLITSGRHDLSLLVPIRAVATDDGAVLPDLSGWRALGKMDFLPGSLWAGASGG